jgi:hypothetical protein
MKLGTERAFLDAKLTRDTEERRRKVDFGWSELYANDRRKVDFEIWEPYEKRRVELDLLLGLCADEYVLRRRQIEKRHWPLKYRVR